MKWIALVLLLAGCGGTPGGSNPPDDECPGPTGPSDPPNLLSNSGFECGEPPTGWTTTGGTLSAEKQGARSGKRAVRLTSTGGALTNLWYEGDAVKSPGTKTYCASAWVRGTAHDARLGFRVVNESGTGMDTNFSSPVNDAWASLHVEAKTNADDTKLLLRVWLPSPNAGDYAVIDDVQLWVSANGRCEERP